MLLDFQPEKSAFAIFCDENAGVSKPKPVVAKSAIPSALVDKENVPVVPRVPALGSLKTVRRFSDSDSSDMEMDSSPESEPEIVKSEWRVPPLGQHQPEVVDIFSAPEYSEVSPLIPDLFLISIANNFFLSGHLQLSPTV